MKKETSKCNKIMRFKTRQYALLVNSSWFSQWLEQSLHVNKLQLHFTLTSLLLWRNYHWSSMSFGVCRNIYTLHDLCYIYNKTNKKETHTRWFAATRLIMQSGQNITSAHFHDLLSWKFSFSPVLCVHFSFSLKESVWQLCLFLQPHWLRRRRDTFS